MVSVGGKSKNIISNHEKSIPSVSPGFITIAIGVHPSRLQIKNKILRLYQT